MKKFIIFLSVILIAVVFPFYIFAVDTIFTEQEISIIQNSATHPILVGVVDSSAPLCSLDPKTKEYDGITLEVMNMIAKKTGLNIKYVPIDMARRELVQQPTETSPDLVLGITYSKELPDTREWFISNSIYEGFLSVVVRLGNDLSVQKKQKTIAISEGFSMAVEYVNIHLPEYKIITYPTLIDCLDAVAKGKVDASIYEQSCINYLKQKPIFQNLEIIPSLSIPLDLCVAAFDKKNMPLIDIINKGLSLITIDEERQTYFDHILSKPYTYTLEDFIYKYYLPIILILLMFLILIVWFSMLMLIRERATKKVQEALELAKKASSSKGTFMSRMSHEIRTPLNAVIGYNTIARNELTNVKTEDERRQAEMKVMDCLTKSDIASRHLLTIINDVLDMAAIENGKIKIAKDVFDFKGLITSLTAVFYSQAKSKGINFEVIFASQMDEWVIGDQMRVNQVLSNLLSNSIKFTPDGGDVTLTIKAVMKESSIDVQFDVKDTGIGMSQEYLSNLWTPFEQADSSIARRFGGTGLGLSITKNFVNLMNGTIDVKSRLGEGTVFTVNLSFEKTNQSEEHALYDFSSLNVLVVDDDQSTCDYIRLLLTRSGVRSSTVTSGLEAIETVKKGIEVKTPYTMCLVDWYMPKMNGIETVKKIREIAGDKLPIIVISAYDYSEIADKAANLGVNMFISKPLFQSTLFNLLVNITGGKDRPHRPNPNLSENLSTYHFDNVHILLAEDNKMNMEIACKVLLSAGCTVDKAWNGQEAVDLFEKNPPGTYKVVLMDVQMPVLDGFSATKLIRTSTRKDGASIPIIALTADAFSENVAEALSAGMNDHVAKPLDFPRFFSTLAKYV